MHLCAARVSDHAVPLALTDLDAGRRKLDQAPQHLGRGTAAAMSVPERLPRLVRLPVVARVEQLDAAMVGAVAKTLRPALSDEEREFYTSYLLYGGPRDATAGRQKQLAGLLRDTLKDQAFAWSPAAVSQLAKIADGETGGVANGTP